MVDIGILDIGKKLILEIPTFYEFHIFVFFFFSCCFSPFASLLTVALVHSQTEITKLQLSCPIRLRQPH